MVYTRKQFFLVFEFTNQVCVKTVNQELFSNFGPVCL